MGGYNAQHQRNIDAQSEPDGEGMSMDVLYDALRANSDDWLADAVCEAVCNGDLAFLVKQVERHVPGWVRP